MAVALPDSPAYILASQQLVNKLNIIEALSCTLNDESDV